MDENSPRVVALPRSRRRSRAERPSPCCWPGCPKNQLLHPVKVPLCAAHLEIAAGVQRDIWTRPTIVTPAPVRAEAGTQPPPKVVRPSHIYYVQVGPHIKIGWTSNLAKRMRQYPPNSQLLAAHPGTRADEARMHRRFAADRTHGREWYVPSVSLLHHIEQTKREHGEPESVSFGAKPVTIPQPRPKQYVGGNYRGNGIVGNQRF